MINVLFFARLKDDIGQAKTQLDDSYAGQSLAQIQQALIEQGLTALQDKSIRVAVNKNFCTPELIVNVGDEIAFMPPVTGG